MTHGTPDAPTFALPARACDCEQKFGPSKVKNEVECSFSR
jgi:hypothetical protein